MHCTTQKEHWSLYYKSNVLDRVSSISFIFCLSMSNIVRKMIYIRNGIRNKWLDLGCDLDYCLDPGLFICCLLLNQHFIFGIQSYLDGWKKVECPLWVRGGILPQVEELKYLRVLFISEGWMEQEIDREISAASAVIWTLYRSVIVKKEVFRFTGWSTFPSSPVVTNSVTKIKRLQIQAAEMGFFWKVAGFSPIGNLQEMLMTHPQAIFSMEKY